MRLEGKVASIGGGARGMEAPEPGRLMKNGVCSPDPSGSPGV